MKFTRIKKLTFKNDNLLSSKQIEYLFEAARRKFHFGGYDSLEDIVTSLDVEVIIESGIHELVIPPCLNALENHWHEELLRCEKLINDEQSKDYYEEVRRKCEAVLKEKECWQSMHVRGLYDPSTNQIKLFPDEMKLEYDGNRVFELLVTTFAHEVMHAYFNREGHKELPYVPFIEEPLAEFGMLYFLHIARHPIQKWAYDDVRNKQTCYHYGATLLNQYKQEPHPYQMIRYLEDYKLDLDYYALPTISTTGVITLPTGRSNSLSQMMCEADNFQLTENDLVTKFIDMMNNQTYYETKGNVFLLFGIIYANQIGSINHAIDIIFKAGFACNSPRPGQAQRIMDGKRLGIILRQLNMV